MLSCFEQVKLSVPENEISNLFERMPQSIQFMLINFEAKDPEAFNEVQVDLRQMQASTGARPVYNKGAGYKHEGKGFTRQ